MLDAILARLRAQPSRTGSLIVTLYGDAILPRGGEVWLGTLLTLFRAMEVGDGVVRTAVSRLAAEGWLARSRVGRNSFYRLSARAEAETRAAAARIYAAPAPEWTGGLHLALLDAGSERDAQRQALAAAGYGAAAPGLMVAPVIAATPDAPQADALRGVLTLRAEAEPAVLVELARRAWPLDALASRYRAFLDAFAADSDAGSRRAAPEAAMVARVVLIHEWRRVVLRDPCLPAPLLPADWPGAAARKRAGGLYAALRPASERWLDAHGRTPHGSLPRPDAGRWRFPRG